MAEKENRCWPGYEPVPGKKPHSQGSCKPKAESKSSPSEKDFRAKRRKQLDHKEAEQPSKRAQSLQHLGPPASTRKATKKKTASTGTKRGAAGAKKFAATKKSTAKKSASRKAVAQKRLAVRKRA